MMDKKKRTNARPSPRTKRTKASTQSNLALLEGLERNIVFNCGSEDSIYRALEDAGVGIPWDEIRKTYESRRKFSPQDEDEIKEFLKEFAHEYNLTIIYQYPSDNNNKQWVDDILGDPRKKQKVAIRHEQRGSYEFTAVFFAEGPVFKQAIALRTTANAKFPCYWPPRNFIGSEKHVDYLREQWKKAFQEVKSVITISKQAFSGADLHNWGDADHSGLGSDEKPLVIGLFARPRSGKSYCFNRLLLTGLTNELNGKDFATIGPSKTSNAIHKLAATILPIRAIYDERRLAITLKKRNEDKSEDGPSVTIVEFESGEREVTEQHLRKAIAKIDEWNTQKHDKKTYVELLIPSEFLRSANIELIDLPGFTGSEMMDAPKVNDTIADYLSAERQRPALLDAVIFLTDGRAVTDSVYSDLYRCGYFSVVTESSPKLIYLVNRIEGLENVEEYVAVDRKPVNNQAEARNEAKRALTRYVFENTELGIDPDFTVTTICERIAATPFFHSDFRGFNTAQDLKKNFMEIRFHKFRCKMLELIKELVRNVLVAEKLGVISAGRKDEQKLRNFWKRAVTEKKKNEEYCRKLKENQREQTEYEINLKQYLDEIRQNYLISEHSKNALRSKMTLESRFRELIDDSLDRLRELKDNTPLETQLKSWLKELIDGYLRKLHEFSQGLKIRLIEDLREYGYIIFNTRDSTQSEALGLIERLLNEGIDRIEKHSLPSSCLPSELSEAANEVVYSLQSESNKERLAKFLANSLNQVLNDTITSLESYYPLPLYESEETSRLENSKLETLKKKIIKYENLLLELLLKFSFSKRPDAKKKRLNGISNAVINRYLAPINDKPKELLINLEKPDYIRCLPKEIFAQNIDISFDLDNKMITVQNNVFDEFKKKLKEASDYQPKDDTSLHLIHPIFIPSKLRGKQRRREVYGGDDDRDGDDEDEDDDDIEVIPPQLYANQLQDFPNTFIIPVVDRSEADRYRNYITLKYKDYIKFMMVIDDSNSKSPINIGRKRHLIKIVAEQVLNLDRYWVIDDDIESFTEFVELLTCDPCSIGRALYYAQQVLQNELNFEDYESKAELLLSEISQMSQCQSKFLELFQPFMLHNKPLREVIVKNPEGFQRLCEMAGLTHKLQGIQKDRLLRVGQVALYNRIDRNPEKRNLLLKGNFSHINRGARYQVVLFNRLAMEGIEYMSREEFFKTSSSQITKRKEMKPKDYKKRMAQGGWKHEDWYIAQKMKDKGRIGYLIFRVCFENYHSSKYPSLVNKVAMDVPKDKEISINQIDESKSSSDVETPD